VKNLKKISAVLLLLVLTFALSGCGSHERLTNMTLVQATGIDYEKNEITVTLQYLDINKGTGTNEGVKGNLTATVKGKGNSIKSAVYSAEKTLPDRLYFAQNKIIVLGSSAEEEIKEELKRFMSDEESCRPDTYVVKSASNAEEVIKNPQRSSRVPAESLCKQLKREKAAFTVNDYLNDLKENKLPVVRSKDNYTVVQK